MRLKRFLVLILVFGVATAAHGAYVPTTVTIDTPYAWAKNSPFTVTVTVSGLPSGRSVTQVDDVDITATGLAHTEGDITPNPFFNTTLSDYADWTDVMLAGISTPGVPNGGILFSFQVTATEDGTPIFDLADTSGAYFVLMLDNNDMSYLSFGTEYGPITVITDGPIIPEPMTIALLGLGGLLLRRRR